MNPYLKAPFNVRGSKYSTLPFLFRYFPKDCDLFLEPFGGSMNVSVNMYREERAKQIHCFDLNEFLMKANADIYRINPPSLLKNLLSSFIISLKEEDLFNYEILKNKYNAMDKHFENYNDISDSLILFLLSCVCEQQEVIMNNYRQFCSKEDNTSSEYRFQKNVSQYLDQLIHYKKSMSRRKNRTMSIGYGDFKDFPYYTLTPKDFCYFDPPSWIMDSFFEQKLLGDWSKQDDQEVWRICNQLNEKKIPFVYTSVLEYKDQRYEELENWVQEKELKMVSIPKIYCSYTKRIKYYDPKVERPLEVLITNF